MIRCLHVLGLRLILSLTLRLSSLCSFPCSMRWKASKCGSELWCFRGLMGMEIERFGNGLFWWTCARILYNDSSVEQKEGPELLIYNYIFIYKYTQVKNKNYIYIYSGRPAIVDVTSWFPLDFPLQHVAQTLSPAHKTRQLRRISFASTQFTFEKWMVFMSKLIFSKLEIYSMVVGVFIYILPAYTPQPPDVRGTFLLAILFCPSNPRP